VCLASDGTHLTNGTGNLKAHPLLMTLDNIDSAVRRRSSNHAFILLALIPEVNGVHCQNANVKRTVLDRIFHAILRLVLAPLCKIAKYGKFMSDPLGQLRFCFTVLSMYMVDQPEAIRLSGVINYTSPVTLAAGRELGDPFRHPPRWWSTTRKEIDRIKNLVHPDHQLEEFVKECYASRLTGVVNTVWDDWEQCEPCIALGYDLLHSSFKFWHDHPFLWATQAVGEQEMDFRYKALHPRRGFRYFRKGVTSLGKTGCREHRDMQRHIMCVIDGKVPREFLRVMRSQLEYTYIAQNSEISEDDLLRINSLLCEFHENKYIAHSKGYRETEGWRIPKLELQWHIITTIAALGNLKGTSTEQSEHEHINQVKAPFRETNRKDHESQMVVGLSRRETLRHFDLATALTSQSDAVAMLKPDQFIKDLGDDGVYNWLDELGTIQNFRGHGKRFKFLDYFAVAKSVENTSNGKPARTFIGNPYTALHLNRTPSLSIISIDEASEMFDLPDLRDAIDDYYLKLTHPHAHDKEGPVLSLSRVNDNLHARSSPEFNGLKIWFNIRVQTKSLQDPGLVNRSATIHATPPQQLDDRLLSKSEQNWVFGRYDCALFINDSDKPFFGSANLQGMLIA
jgi:hypothetical protein